MASSLISKSIVLVGCLFVVLILSTIYFAADGNHQRHIKQVRDVSSQTKEADNTKFGFDDVFGYSFRYKSVSPRWISGNEYIYKSSNNSIYLRNVETTLEKELMDGSVYKNKSANAYKVSSTQDYILLRTNYVKGWRHSYNATYLVYDVTATVFLADDTLPGDIQYITWSPVGNALAYVRGFNIFYRSSPNADDVQVTDDGRANYIYNGIPDWVYEEEMISSNNVMYFSPDGMHLAFARFDDSNCSHIQFIRYDEHHYPLLVDVSYPKAGTIQPTSKVFIYDIQQNDTKEILPQKSLIDNGDYLFNRVVWANTSRAAVLWCNRAQNWSVMSMCDYINFSWDCINLPQYEHIVDGGWLYQRRPYWIPLFGRNADEFFKVLPNENWQHLARIDNDGNEFLTQGDYTVTSESASYPSVYFYDEVNDYVYFLATIEGPGKRQIYRVSGHNPAASYPHCVSCSFAEKHPGRCDYVTGLFSKDGSFVVLNCRGESAPIYAELKVNGNATESEPVLTELEILEDNQDLMDNIEATQMSSVKHSFFLSSTGYEFHYEMWLPPEFKQSNQYPLLIDVYAGPGYQNVDYLWTRSWAPRYVPVGLNAIVVRIDGRGSNFYGDKFMHEVYGNLGQKEIEDQIEAARYFGELSYVDASRIAIWGWSYGGFATSHAVGLGTDIIKCGMAVAPLTDWELYDTIYAERYLGLPQHNREGYDKANVMKKAKNFSSSRYLLIHGMTDDNVHFQNAALLEKSLVAANVDFKNFFYADQDHSINVGGAQQHIYKILTKELCACFGIAVPDDVW